MQTYQLYKSFTATANAGAQIQIIKGGRIVGVQWSINAIVDGAGSYVVECSLVPIFQSTTNDAKGVIASVSYQADSATAVGINGLGQVPFHPVDVPVSAGQLVYLNATIVNFAAANAFALLSVR